MAKKPPLCESQNGIALYHIKKADCKKKCMGSKNFPFNLNCGTWQKGERESIENFDTACSVDNVHQKRTHRGGSYPHHLLELDQCSKPVVQGDQVTHSRQCLLGTFVHSGLTLPRTADYYHLVSRSGKHREF